MYFSQEHNGLPAASKDGIPCCHGEVEIKTGKKWRKTWAKLKICTGGTEEEIQEEVKDSRRMQHLAQLHERYHEHYLERPKAFGAKPHLLRHKRSCSVSCSLFYVNSKLAVIYIKHAKGSIKVLACVLICFTKPICPGSTWTQEGGSPRRDTVVRKSDLM